MRSPNRTLFYVVDWLPPDFGAVGQYGLGFATDLARAGRNVCVVGLTIGERRSSACSVGGGALEIVRLSAARYDKSRLARRLSWTLRANTRLLWEVVRRRESQRADLLFTGAPPFFLYFAVLAKLLRRVRLTYRITDFYPEVLIAEASKSLLPLCLLQSLTWFMRRRVDNFQVLGCDQRQLLLAGGIPATRITVRRDTSPVAITGRERPVPVPPELAGRKILLYSGNYGVPHEADTVVEGFLRHYRDGQGRVGLWLNATGRNAERVEVSLRNAGVALARGTPVPLDQLPSLIAAADAHLVTLRSGFAGIVLPSKIYACLDSRKPILFVGPQSSDVHRLCMERAPSRYWQINPGDAAGFATALEQLAASVS